MKAVLIDAVNKAVKVVEIGEGIDDYYKYLNCRTFDVVSCGGGVDLYIDDEGLIKNAWVDEDGTKHNLHGFKLPGMANVLMGNGIVMGHDPNTGESLPCPVPVEAVKAVVEFVEYDSPEDRPQPQMFVTSW